jgi:hypothetical protein
MRSKNKLNNSITGTKVSVKNSYGKNYSLFYKNYQFITINVHYLAIYILLSVSNRNFEIKKTCFLLFHNNCFFYSSSTNNYFFFVS